MDDIPEQLELLWRQPEYIKGATIQERFQHFHKLNPWVYDELVAIAYRAKDKGYKRHSVDALFQILRWERWRPTIGEKWKLNDHYRSRYARMIMENEPNLLGFFEIRELRSP